MSFCISFAFISRENTFKPVTACVLILYVVHTCLCTISGLFKWITLGIGQCFSFYNRFREHSVGWMGRQSTTLFQFQCVIYENRLFLPQFSRFRGIIRFYLMFCRRIVLLFCNLIYLVGVHQSSLLSFVILTIYIIAISKSFVIRYEYLYTFMVTIFLTILWTKVLICIL